MNSNRLPAIATLPPLPVSDPLTPSQTFALQPIATFLLATLSNVTTIAILSQRISCLHSLAQSPAPPLPCFRNAMAIPLAQQFHARAQPSQTEVKELTGSTKLKVPGYTDLVEFGVLHEFEYKLADGSGGIGKLAQSCRLKRLRMQQMACFAICPVIASLPCLSSAFSILLSCFVARTRFPRSFSS